jgi:3-dehydroquinate dehydratase/shikimate dehydrogenase
LPKEIDAVEVRADYCFFSVENMILTLRKKSHGGQFTGSEEERYDLLKGYLRHNPLYVDLEYDSSRTLISLVGTERLILSYHNHQETPQDLETLFDRMRSTPAAFYKIATFANSSLDTLRLLEFGKKHRNLTVIPMGEKGSFGRVLGKIFGNPLNYTFLETPTAEGQVSYHDLINIYHYPDLNENTELFGLIGDPINQSIGHIYHNLCFKKQKRNAVYVKMQVTKEEVPSFLPLASCLGFKGLSITMPLKEVCLPNACINTLHNQIGYNTDGRGALDAIESHLSIFGKHILILGTGGTAKAIDKEAKQRGALCSFLSRSKERCYTATSRAPDIIVSCAPYPPIVDLSSFPTSTWVMDCVYTPKVTPLLQKALELGMRVIYGEEMFENQAHAQQELWSR